MKKLLLGLTLCFCQFVSFGQQSKIDSLQNILKITADGKTSFALYQALMNEADKQYAQKQFERAANLYEQAFPLNPPKDINTIYNAACSWARCGNKENAFND